MGDELSVELIEDVIADLRAGRLRGQTLNRVEHRDGLVYLYAAGQDEAGRDRLLICTTEEKYRAYLPS